MVAYDKGELLAVREMATTDGWQFLREHLEENIKGSSKQLISRKFDDLAQVNRIQERVAALISVINFVETRVREAEKL